MIFNAYGNDFECVKMCSWFDFFSKISLLSLGFFLVKNIMQRMRKWDIYRHQEQGKWKDKFALWNRRSAVSFCGQTAELDRRTSPERTGEPSAVSFGGFVTADHARRLRPREIKSPRSERRFRTAVGNRRSEPRKLARAFWTNSAVSFCGQAAERNRRFTKNSESQGEAKGILHKWSSRKTKHS